MGIGNNTTLQLNLEKGEPTLVPPAEDTNQKGTLYFLSNVDHRYQVKVRTVYCFKPSDNRGGDDVTEVIRDALSKVLVHYYPVAGRLTTESDGRLAVDCNDEGVVFVEAKADCSIEEIGDDTVTMEKLVYDVPAAIHILDVPPLAVQVTKFKDGGFVLGICVNHMIFDGPAAMDFLNSWGEIARGLSLKVPPSLDRTLLKARNPPKIEFDHQEYLHMEDISNTSELFKEELLYKWFCFDVNKLERVKTKAMEDGVLGKCSTFEAMSGFIWKSRTQALKLKHDQKTKLLLVVDGRSRYDPPLPENYFGNGVGLTSCICTAGELMEKPVSFAVRLVQDAIQMVTDGYMRSAIDYLEVTRANPSMTLSVLISTWTRLSFDSTDFGWGQPFIAGRASLPGKETALFLAHPKEKKSMNVCVSFPASSMKIFEELIDI
ncbi:hypothetical protein Vadar_018418 [Vaccinium darrowii]|uniref:Uncharacterized protein n=1 Tax=Vaccinium darrowii TaxID=229202 RepID=A0ACB7X1Q8_9ERIC|nr:hypothetical protein Vadar_018418 [Vaccinium darrowii]